MFMRSTHPGEVLREELEVCKRRPRPIDLSCS
jgi:hypothetical protein